jgi:hypothetical protein
MLCYLVCTLSVVAVKSKLEWQPYSITHCEPQQREGGTLLTLRQAKQHRFKLFHSWLSPKGIWAHKATHRKLNVLLLLLLLLLPLLLLRDDLA